MESVKYIKEDDLKRIREVLKYKNKPVILELINFGVNVALRISDLQKLKFQDITRMKIKDEVFLLNRNTSSFYF